MSLLGLCNDALTGTSLFVELFSKLSEFSLGEFLNKFNELANALSSISQDPELMYTEEFYNEDQFN